MSMLDFFFIGSRLLSKRTRVHGQTAPTRIADRIPFVEASRKGMYLIWSRMRPVYRFCRLPRYELIGSIIHRPGQLYPT